MNVSPEFKKKKKGSGTWGAKTEPHDVIKNFSLMSLVSKEELWIKERREVASAVEQLHGHWCFPLLFLFVTLKSQSWGSVQLGHLRQLLPLKYTTCVLKPLCCKYFVSSHSKYTNSEIKKGRARAMPPPSSALHTNTNSTACLPRGIHSVYSQLLSPHTMYTLASVLHVCQWAHIYYCACIRWGFCTIHMDTPANVLSVCQYAYCSTCIQYRLLVLYYTYSIVSLCKNQCCAWCWLVWSLLSAEWTWSQPAH